MTDLDRKGLRLLERALILDLATCVGSGGKSDQALASMLYGFTYRAQRLVEAKEKLKPNILSKDEVARLRTPKAKASGKVEVG